MAKLSSNGFEVLRATSPAGHVFSFRSNGAILTNLGSRWILANTKPRAKDWKKVDKMLWVEKTVQQLNEKGWTIDPSTLKSKLELSLNLLKD